MIGVVGWMQRYVHRKVDEVLRPTIDELNDQSVARDASIDQAAKELRQLNGSARHRHPRDGAL